MDLQTVIIGGTSGFITLAGGFIIYVIKASTQIALNKQRAEFAIQASEESEKRLSEKINKLDNRVQKFEDDLSAKIDKLIEQVNQLNIRFAGIK